MNEPGGQLPGDADAAIRQLYRGHAAALHGYVERFCTDPPDRGGRREGNLHPGRGLPACPAPADRVLHQNADRLAGERPPMDPPPSCFSTIMGSSRTGAGRMGNAGGDIAGATYAAVSSPSDFGPSRRGSWSKSPVNTTSAPDVRVGCPVHRGDARRADPLRGTQPAGPPSLRQRDRGSQQDGTAPASGAAPSTGRPPAASGSASAWPLKPSTARHPARTGATALIATYRLSLQNRGRPANVRATGMERTRPCGKDKQNLCTAGTRTARFRFRPGQAPCRGEL
jgi:hypothetical protein